MSAKQGELTKVQRSHIIGTIRNQCGNEVADKLQAALLAADGKAGGEVHLFPRYRGSAEGWTLDFKFLESVQEKCRETDEAASLEEIEATLLAAETLFNRSQQAAQVAQPLTEERVERMVEAYTRYQIRVDRGYSQQEEGMRLALIAGGFISADTKIIDAETEAP